MVENRQDTGDLVLQKRKMVGYAVAFVLAALAGFSMISCSKPEPVQPIRVDTATPPPSSATGVIAYFTAQDTLVGYNHKSSVKWYVTGTNSRTIVSLNGTQVIFQDAIQTWPLTMNTVFTLSVNVNGGLQESRTIKVADSVTTFLWNEGKRWVTNNVRKLTDVPGKGVFGQDSVFKIWVSGYADVKDYYRDFRTQFKLDGKSSEDQSNAFPKPAPSGNFSIIFPWAKSVTKFGLFWKGGIYNIDTMSVANKELVLSMDSVKNGVTTFHRIRYISEF